jgi:hypothetical protein
MVFLNAAGDSLATGRLGRRGRKQRIKRNLP